MPARRCLSHSMVELKKGETAPGHTQQAEIRACGLAPGVISCKLLQQWWQERCGYQNF